MSERKQTKINRGYIGEECGMSAAQIAKRERRARGLRLAAVFVLFFAIFVLALFGANSIVKSAFYDGSLWGDTQGETLGGDRDQNDLVAGGEILSREEQRKRDEATYGKVVEARAYSSYATTWSNTITNALANTSTTYSVSFNGWTASSSDSYNFGNTTGFTSGALYVPSGAHVILTMYGDISRNLSSARSSGYVMYVAGTLTLRASSTSYGLVSGYTSSRYSTGGIYVASGGVVNFESGRIYNCRTTANDSGAAVYIASGGTFNLKGGYIRGNNNTYNSSTSSGAVHIASGGTFNMTSGNINSNTCSGRAGAIFSNSSRTCSISGGSIYSNTSTNDTSGCTVYMNSGTFYMTGGSIYSNKVGTNGFGVYATSTSLGGSAGIYSNTTTASVAKNLYTGNNQVTIVSRVTGTINYYYSSTINGASYPNGYPITKGWGTYAASYNPVNNFVSDVATHRFNDYSSGSTREAALLCIDPKSNWSNAVSASSSSSPRTVKLYADWVAPSHSSYYTSFGGTGYNYTSTSNAFYYGALQVPSNKNVVLDLNGYSVNRNLSSSQTYSYGTVIFNWGTLRIINSASSKSGYIRNGNSTSYAGGIHSSGTLYMESGYVYNNRGITAGGVYAPSFYMQGNVKISSNTCTSNSLYNELHTAQNVIHVTGAISGASITVYRIPNNGTYTNGTPVTSGYGKYNTTSPTSYFYSADSGKYQMQSMGSGTSLEAAVWNLNNFENWRDAVNASSSSSPRTVKLTSNWAASSHNSYGTSFGATNTAYTSSSNPYYYGALNVPSGKNVILDLAGYRLDRSLSSAYYMGCVIYNNGTLKIINSSSSTGYIRNGKNTSGAGGIYSNGTLYMESGYVYNNTGTTAGGVYAPTLYLKGNVNIRDNTCSSDAKYRDLYTGQNRININGALSGAYVSLYFQPNNGLNVNGTYFTSGYGTYNTSAPSSFFVSSDSKYYVKSYGSGTSMEGVMWCNDNYENWVNAVAYSTSSSPRTVQLTSSWTASSHNNYSTSFGATNKTYTSGSDPFFYGALQVPSGKNIVLDLRGYTLHRNLSSARSYGFVIIVRGKLTLIDSTGSTSSYVRGGFTSDSGLGSGVQVESGAVFRQTGGTVYSNRSSNSNSAGVWGNGTVELGGAPRIYSNSNSSTTADLNVPTLSNKIRIVSQFTGNAYIGLARTVIGDFTTGWGQYNTNSPTSYFFADNTSASKLVATGTGTAMEGAILSLIGANNWEYAVSNSSTNVPKTCLLYSNWTAASNSSYTMAFGTNSSYYSNGALYVPSGKYVVLDLNNCTINRNLSSARGSGYVIRVAGKLEIIDSSSSKSGTIRGGFSSDTCGGIYVDNGGSVKITAGYLRYNKTSSSYSALYYSGGGTFEMTGGYVTSNTATTTGRYAAYFGSANVRLGASAYIYGNTDSAGAERDVEYSNNSYRFNIISTLTSNFRVGIYRTTNNQSYTSGNTFTSGFGSYVSSSANATSYFVSTDASNYRIQNSGTGTGKEAAVWCINNRLNWEHALAASSTYSPKTVQLYSDWTAASHNNYTTSFGATNSSYTSTGSYYYYGALQVSSGRNVVLDLNGYSLNRGLGSARSYGSVIYVRGRFTLTDSTGSTSSYVRGGYTSDSNTGSGIYVESGAIYTQTGGSVYYNRSSRNTTYGVYVNGTVQLGGKARIYSNTGASSVKANLFMPSSANMIQITSQFVSGASVYLSRASIGNFTKGWGTYNTSSPKSYFTPDISNVDFVQNGSGTTAEGAILSRNNVTNWEWAVGNSSTYNPLTATMYTTWTANTNSSYQRAFGTNGNYYKNGALYVPRGRNVILDLNNQTVTKSLSSSNSYGYVIYVSGILEITDSYAERGGVITGGYNNSGCCGIFVDSGATLKISGGRIYNNKSNTGYCIQFYSGGTFEMTGGRIYSNKGNAAVYAPSATVKLGGTANISSNSNNNSVAANLSYDTSNVIAITKAPASGFNVGLYRTANSAYYPDGAKFTSGWGTLTTAAPTSYFFSDNADYRVVNTGTGTSLEAGLICLNNYKNWVDAVNASSSSTPRTCKLWSNWTADSHSTYSTSFGAKNTTYSSTSNAFYYGALQVPSSKNVILDLNGFTLHRNLSSARSGGSVIYVRGKFTLTDSTGSTSSRVRGGYTSDSYAGSGIYVDSGAVYTQTGGSVYYNRSSRDTSYGIYAANGTVNMGGGARVYSNSNSVSNANLYCPTNKVNIISQFTSSASIATARRGMGIFTSGFGTYNTNQPTSVFYSDYSDVTLGSTGTGTNLEGMVISHNPWDNWEFAIHTSQASGKQPATCKLYQNWTAQTHNSYVKSFGTVSNCYTRGALYVPSNAYVQLDLSGYRIDRALTKDQSYGYVIYVAGTLEIISNGYIRGGFNYDSNSAGGIHVASGGKFIMRAGTIYNNRCAQYSGRYSAVYVSDGGEFEMTGGEIRDNTGHLENYYAVYANTAKVSLGGGAYIYNNYYTKNGSISSSYQANFSFANSSNKINIVSAFTSSARIGLYRTNNNALNPDGSIFTQDYGKFNGTTNVSNYFYSNAGSIYQIRNVTLTDETAGTSTTEGTVLCIDNFTNWQTAVQTSINYGGRQMPCKLYSNWTAKSDANFTTSFGAGTGFSDGALYVPSNANVVLDLAGYTVNRGLSRAQTNGFVVRVAGYFTLTDSVGTVSTQGSLTGGYSSDAASGIYVTSGGVTLTGGKVTGNRGYNTGTYLSNVIFGVYVSGMSSFALGDKAELYGNQYQNASGTRDANLYLPNTNNKIKVVSELTGTQKIGVTRQAPGALTQGYNTTTYQNAANPRNRFSSEDKDYTVAEEAIDGEAYLMSFVNHINWEFAIDMSLSHGGAPYTCTLYSNWNAEDNSSFATAFGTNTRYYNNGGLYVPRGASVVLDLAGFNVNRDLNTARSYGYVFYVAGSLEIIDSSETKEGVITGGNNYASNTAGGIFVAGGGSFTLTRGKITGNASTGSNSGSAIYLAGTSTFNYCGGSVTNNVGPYGVFVAGNSALNLGKPSSGTGAAEELLVVLSGNKNTAGAQRNVYFALGTNTVKVNTKLNASSKIGVMRVRKGLITANYGTYNDVDPVTYFSADDANYQILNERVTDGSGRTPEALLYSFVNFVNWEYAIDESLATHGSAQPVALYSDWLTTAAENYAYGNASRYYLGGGLYVPAGAHVVLEMNGWSINRSLAAARSNGFVIAVAGTLEIVHEGEQDPVTGDNSHQGTTETALITGGKNNSGNSAGGIVILSGGSVIIGDKISVTGNEAYGSSSAGGIYSAGKLDVTDTTIVKNSGTTAGGVLVSASGNFTLNSGKINENRSEGTSGGGVYTVGKFTMTEGEIVKNDAKSGTTGGVYIGRGGSFTMDGGRIADNEGPTGGVYVYNNAATKFTLNAGEITGNKATSGGGAYIAGQFEMTGGSIHDNSATGTTGDADEGGGSGVYVASSGVMTMTGGSIVNNVGNNGVRVFSSGVLNVGGQAQIHHNTTTAGGTTENNVYLNVPTRFINVTSELQTGAKIGVTRDTAGRFTTGLGEQNGESVNPNDYFYSDNGKYSADMSKLTDVTYKYAPITVTIPDDRFTAIEAVMGTPLKKPTPGMNADGDIALYNSEEQLILYGYDKATMSYRADRVPEGVKVTDAGEFYATDAKSYAIVFMPQNTDTTYCWSDGTITDYTIYGKIDPLPVIVEWFSNEKFDETQVETDADGNALHYGHTYDGKLYVPTAKVTNIQKNDIAKYTTEEFPLEISGGQVNAGTHLATVNSVGDPNYTAIGSTSKVTTYVTKYTQDELDAMTEEEKKALSSVAGLIKDDAAAAQLQFIIYRAPIDVDLLQHEVVFGETLRLGITGNTGNGKVSYSVKQIEDTHEHADYKGDAQIKDETVLDPLLIGFVYVTADVQETANYQGLTKDILVEVKRGKTPLTLTTKSVAYGNTETLEYALASVVPAEQYANCKVTYQVISTSGASATYAAITTDKDGNAAIQGLNVGQARIQIDIEAFWNYEETTVYANVDVTPRQVMLDWTQDGNYDAATGKTSFLYNRRYQVPKPVVTNPAFTDKAEDLKISVTVSFPKDASGAEVPVAGKTVGVDVGDYLASAYYVNNPNYIVGDASKIVEWPYSITKADLTGVTIDTLKAIFGEDLSLALKGAPVDPEMKVEWAIAKEATDDGDATIATDSNVFTPVKAGHVTVSATLSNMDNYNDLVVTGLVEIAKSEAEIRLTTLTAVYGDDYTLAVEGGEPDDPAYAVTYFIVTDAGETPIASIKDGNVLVTTNIGTVKVKVTVAETTNRLETSVTAEVTVSPRPLEIVWADENSFVYDGTPHSATVSEIKVINSDEIKVSISDMKTNAGAYVATITGISGTDSAKYTLAGGINLSKEYKITPRALEVVWKEPFEFIYNGQEQCPEVELTNIIDGDSVTASVKGAKDAGTHTAQVTSLDNSNYVLAYDVDASGNHIVKNSTKTFTIKPYAVTFAWTEPSDSGKIELPYNQQAQAPEARVVDGFAGDTFTLTISGKGVNVNAEDSPYVATVTGLGNDNYTLDGAKNVSVQFWIIKVDMPLSLESATVTYGSSLKLVASGNLEGGVVTFTADGGSDVADFIDGVIYPKKVGEFVITMSVAETANYNATTKQATVTVTPLPVVLGWSNFVFDYDGLQHVPTAQVMNRVAGDTCEVAAITGIARNAGTHEAEAISLSNPNYTTVGGTNITWEFTINPRVVVVQWDAERTFTYNGTEQAPKVSFTNIINGETCNGTVSGAVNAGSHKATLTGVDNDNYTIVGAKNTTVDFKIEKAAIDLSFTTTTATYGTDLTLSLNGNLGSGNESYTMTGVADINDEAGNGAEEEEGGDEGGDSGETGEPTDPEPEKPVNPYTGAAVILPGSKVFTPTRAGTVQVTATVAETENYLGGTVVAEFTIEKAEPQLDSDSLTVEYGAIFNYGLQGYTKDQLTYSIVNKPGDTGTVVMNGEDYFATKIGVATVSVAVAETVNYKATTLEVTVTITPRVAQIGWDVIADPFVYDGTEKKPTAYVDNLVTIDDVTDVCTVTVTGQVDAGEGLTATAVSLSNSNYTLEGAEGVTTTFDIERAPITVKLLTTEAKMGEDTVLQVSGAPDGAVIIFEITGKNGTEPELPPDPEEGEGGESGSETGGEGGSDTGVAALADEGDGTTTEPTDPNPTDPTDPVEPPVVLDTGMAVINGTTFTPVRAGTVTVTVYVGETKNTLPAEDTGVITISKGTPSLELAEGEAIYGTTYELLLSQASIDEGYNESTVLGFFFNEEEELTAPDGSVIENGNSFLPHGVGEYTLYVKVGETANNEAGFVKVTLNVTPRPIQVSWLEIPETSPLVYNGSEQHPDAIVSNNTAWDDPNDIVLTIKGQTNAGENLIAQVVGIKNKDGSDNIHYTVSGGENLETTFTIQKAPASGLAFATTEVNFNDTLTLGLTGTLENGDIFYEVQYGPDDTGEATIAGDVFTPVKAGTVSVVAVVEETDNYLSGTVNGVITIKRIKLDLGLVETSVIYGEELTLALAKSEEDEKFEAEAVFTIPEGNGIVRWADEKHTKLIGIKAGTVKIKYVIAASTNYDENELEAEITVEKRPVELSWNDLEFTYDGQTHKPRASVSNTVFDDDDAFVVTVSGEEKNAGNYVASVTDEGLSNPNYTVAGGKDVEKDFVINPRVVTLEWEATEEYTYNGKAQAPKVKVTNLITADGTTDSCEVTVKVRGAAEGEYIEAVNASDTAYTAVAVELDNTNYTLADAENTTKQFKINQAAITLTITTLKGTYGQDLTLKMTVKVGDETTVYEVKLGEVGANTSKLENGALYYRNGDVQYTVLGVNAAGEADTGTATISGETLTPTAAGTVTVQGSVPETNNTLAATTTATIEIERAKQPVDPPHECEHKCPTCGKCQNKDCTNEVCKEKCECPPEHECEHKCPDCGKCQDPYCTHPVCAEKCKCHHCTHVCPDCGGCYDMDCEDETCANKCTCEPPPEHACESKCEVCGGCKNQSCTDPLCATKCTCHTCEHKCSTCGKCQDPYCTHPNCAEKCECEPEHLCEHVCPTCGKCKDKYCGNAACVEKCECKSELGEIKLDVTEVVYGGSIVLSVSGVQEDGEVSYSVTGGYGTDSLGASGKGQAAISVSADGIATLSGLEAGTVRVKVKIAATRNYEATEAEFDVTVKPRPVAVGWVISSCIYNGKTQFPTAQVTNLLAGDSVSLTVKGAIDAGDHVAEVTALNNGNYTLTDGSNLTANFTIKRKPITVVWDDTTLLFTYDGKTHVPEASVPQGGAFGLVQREDTGAYDGCTVTVAGAQKNAGVDYPATATSLGNSNYMFDDSAPVTTNFTIKQAPLDDLTILTEKVTYNTPAAIQIGGNAGNGAVTYSVAQTGDAGDEGNAAFTKDNILLASHVGYVDVTITVAETPNYLGKTITKRIEIEKAVMPLKLVADHVTYGDSLTLALTGNPENGAIEYRITGDSTKVKFKDDAHTVLKGIGAGDTELTVTVAETTNYRETEIAFPFKVNPKKVELAWSTLELTYNGQLQSPSAVVTNLIEDEDIHDTGKVTVVVSGAAVNAGSYTAEAARLEGEASANYTLSGVEQKTVAFDIGKVQISIEIITTHATYGDVLTLQVSGNLGGAPVTYTIIDGNTDLASISGDQFTPKGQGEVNVRAEVPEMQNYLGAYDEETIYIGKGEMHLKVETTSVIYGKDTEIIVSGVRESAILRYTITNLTGKANMTGKVLRPLAVGTVAITVKAEETQNYNASEVNAEIEILPCPLFIEWDPTTLEYTYDGQSHLPSATVMGLIGSESCNVLVTGAQTNAGTYTATATGLDNPNFCLAAGAKTTQEFTIKKAQIAGIKLLTKEAIVNVPTYLEISGNTVNAPVTYEIVSNPASSGTAAISGNLLMPARLGRILVKATIADTANYTGATTEDWITILKPLAPIKITSTEMTYGDELELTISGNDEFGEELYAFTNGTGSVVWKDDTHTAVIGTKAGTVTITVTVGETSSYRETTVEAELAIKQRALGFDWSDLQPVYNGAKQQPSFTLQNVVTWADGTPDALTASITALSGESINVGDYYATVTLGGDAKDNYIMQTDDGFRAYRITPKEATLTVTSLDIKKEFTGEVIEITDWYRFAFEELVGKDVGKELGELFDLASLNVTAEFWLDGEKSEPVYGGEYEIRPVTASDRLTGNDNYTVKVVIDPDYGILTVEGGTLMLKKDSSYRFLQEVSALSVVGDELLLRRSYKAFGWEHGKDDQHLERFVLGDIMPNTTINEFLENVSPLSRNTMLLYTQDGVLVYARGAAASGFEDRQDELYVGTGWKIIVGTVEKPFDTVYLSILGDLSGDGIVSSIDVSMLYSYASGALDLLEQEMEYRLAAYILNEGMVVFEDAEIAKTFMKSADDIADYFELADEPFTMPLPPAPDPAPAPDQGGQEEGQGDTTTGA